MSKLRFTHWFKIIIEYGQVILLSAGECLSPRLVQVSKLRFNQWCLIIIEYGQVILLFAGECLSPAQVCDGLADCGAGAEDEAEDLCHGRECRHGVRCEQTGQCLHSPHRQLCTGQHLKLRQ